MQFVYRQTKLHITRIFDRFVKSSYHIDFDGAICYNFNQHVLRKEKTLKSGDGLPKYTGKKRRCDWCEAFFRKGDMVDVVYPGFIFCHSALELESPCLKSWSDSHYFTDIKWIMKDFQGKVNDSMGDSGASI